MQAYRIEVNRFDGQGWSPWGFGHTFEAATADGLIRFMGPDPERRKLEAAGLAIPAKLLRKVPVIAAPSASVQEAPQHYYEVRDPAGVQLACGMVAEDRVLHPSYVPEMLSRFPEGTTFRSEAVRQGEVYSLAPETEGAV